MRISKEGRRSVPEAQEEVPAQIEEKEDGPLNQEDLLRLSALPSTHYHPEQVHFLPIHRLSFLSSRRE